MHLAIVDQIMQNSHSSWMPANNIQLVTDSGVNRWVPRGHNETSEAANVLLHCDDVAVSQTHAQHEPAHEPALPAQLCPHTKASNTRLYSHLHWADNQAGAWHRSSKSIVKQAMLCSLCDVKKSAPNVFRSTIGWEFLNIGLGREWREPFHTQSFRCCCFVKTGARGQILPSLSYWLNIAGGAPTHWEQGLSMLVHRSLKTSSLDFVALELWSCVLLWILCKCISDVEKILSWDLCPCPRYDYSNSAFVCQAPWDFKWRSWCQHSSFQRHTCLVGMDTFPAGSCDVM